MKTRADIYGQEAMEILRIINLYPGLWEQQLYGFFTGKEEKVMNLLSHLKRQGRITQDDTGRIFPYGKHVTGTDISLIRSVWVLLDFIDRAEFHSTSEFPVKIIFFADGELYEIIHIAYGQEALVTHALSIEKKHTGRRIVLVDDPAQIHCLNFPGISGFCTTDSSGRINYYKKTNGGM